MAKVKSTKVPVALRALMARINRKLAKDDEVLKIARGALRQEVGDYYLLDLHNNRIGERRVDPEAFGRKLGLLQPWEELS